MPGKNKRGLFFINQGFASLAIIAIGLAVVGIASIATIVTRNSKKASPSKILTLSGPCSPNGAWNFSCYGEKQSCPDNQGVALIYYCDSGNWIQKSPECKSECAVTPSNTPAQPAGCPSSNCIASSVYQYLADDFKSAYYWDNCGKYCPNSSKPPTPTPTPPYTCNGNNLQLGPIVIDICSNGCDPTLLKCRPTPGPTDNCTYQGSVFLPGAFRCPEGSTSYYVCEHANWITRNCNEGTKCQNNRCETIPPTPTPTPKPIPTSTPSPTPAPVPACPNLTCIDYNTYTYLIDDKSAYLYNSDCLKYCSVPTKTPTPTPTAKPTAKPGLSCNGNDLMQGFFVINTCSNGCNPQTASCNPTPAPSDNCLYNGTNYKMGDFRCPENSTNYYVCEHANWITRNCNEGTKCQNNRCETIPPTPTPTKPPTSCTLNETKCSDSNTLSTCTSQQGVKYWYGIKCQHGCQTTTSGAQCNLLPNPTNTPTPTLTLVPSPSPTPTPINCKCCGLLSCGGKNYGKKSCSLLSSCCDYCLNDNSTIVPTLFPTPTVIYVAQNIQTTQKPIICSPGTKKCDAALGSLLTCNSDGTDWNRQICQYTNKDLYRCNSQTKACFTYAEQENQIMNTNYQDQYPDWDRQHESFEDYAIRTGIPIEKLTDAQKALVIAKMMGGMALAAAPGMLVEEAGGAAITAVAAKVAAVQAGISVSGGTTLYLLNRLINAGVSQETAVNLAKTTASVGQTMTKAGPVMQKAGVAMDIASTVGMLVTSGHAEAKEEVLNKCINYAMDNSLDPTSSIMQCYENYNHADALDVIAEVSTYTGLTSMALMGAGVSADILGFSLNKAKNFNSGTVLLSDLHGYNDAYLEAVREVRNNALLKDRPMVFSGDSINVGKSTNVLGSGLDLMLQIGEDVSQGNLSATIGNHEARLISLAKAAQIVNSDGVNSSSVADAQAVLETYRASLSPADFERVVADPEKYLGALKDWELVIKDGGQVVTHGDNLDIIGIVVDRSSIPEVAKGNPETIRILTSVANKVENPLNGKTYIGTLTPEEIKIIGEVYGTSDDLVAKVNARQQQLLASTNPADLKTINGMTQMMNQDFQLMQHPTEASTYQQVLGFDEINVGHNYIDEAAAKARNLALSGQQDLSIVTESNSCTVSGGCTIVYHDSNLSPVQKAFKAVNQLGYQTPEGQLSTQFPKDSLGQIIVPENFLGISSGGQTSYTVLNNQISGINDKQIFGTTEYISETFYRTIAAQTIEDISKGLQNSSQ